MMRVNVLHDHYPLLWLEGTAGRKQKVITSRNLSLDTFEVRLGNTTNHDRMQNKHFFVKRKPIPFLASARRTLQKIQYLFGSFREGTDCLGRNSETFPTETFYLEVNAKSTASMSFGMAYIVTGFGTPAGHFAYTAHTSKENCLVTKTSVS